MSSLRSSIGAVLGLLALWGAAGCGGSSRPEGGGSLSASAPAAAGGIEITANDQMKYGSTEVEAAAGATVTITLRNIGRLPKSAMGHNLVLFGQPLGEPEIQAFLQAAIAAGPPEYFPAGSAAPVLAHLRMLGPAESASATFTAPSAPGRYPFVCTFPGHAAAGMRGVLVVR